MTGDTRLYTNMINKKDQNAANLLTARRCFWLQSDSVCHLTLTPMKKGLTEKFRE